MLYNIFFVYVLVFMVKVYQVRPWTYTVHYQPIILLYYNCILKVYD